MDVQSLLNFFPIIISLESNSLSTEEERILAASVWTPDNMDHCVKNFPMIKKEVISKTKHMLLTKRKKEQPQQNMFVQDNEEQEKQCRMKIKFQLFW